MKNKRFWVDLSMLNLVAVAFLGFALRSKILFPMPMINYTNLLAAHEHFAFGGWVTFALMILMVNELLPRSLNSKPVYQWLIGGTVLISWCMLFSFYLKGNGSLSDFFSTVFIFNTYVFGWIFIRDMFKANLSKTVLLLAFSSVICLVVSSAGPFTLAYLFASKSLNAIFYRDALFTYLHFQYNGFFTLSVFALLFHKLQSKIASQEKKRVHNFAMLLCILIIPSLFLSYLWQDPNNILRVFAIIGSILVFVSFISFIITALSLINVYKKISPLIRFIGLMSISAFMLKMFLQSFTIFPSVGNAVFGDRPMIIGFLHLVFLGFVSLFILAYFGQKGFLNIQNKFTKLALIVFTSGVILNETVLMGQGLGAMFSISNQVFPLLLWGISILLFIGTFLIVLARFKSKTLSRSKELIN